MVGRHIQDVVDGAGVQYAPLVRDNICGSRTMDAKDAAAATPDHRAAGSEGSLEAWI